MTDAELKGYHERNDRLSALGYVRYQDYLKSDDWKRIRDKKLAHHRDCKLCRGPSQVVHHVDYRYDTLLGLCPLMLVPLCHRCHERIEVCPDGRKRSLDEANAELFRLGMEARTGGWVGAIRRKLKRRGNDIGQPLRNQRKTYTRKGKQNKPKAAPLVERSALPTQRPEYAGRCRDCFKKQLFGTARWRTVIRTACEFCGGPLLAFQTNKVDVHGGRPPR